MGYHKNLFEFMNRFILLIALLGVAFCAVERREKALSASCKLAVSKNGRCGARFGNTRCAGNKTGVYCSRWNWCGTSALHKKTAQAKFNSLACGAPKKVVKKAKKAGKKPAKKVVKKAKKVVKKAKKAAKKGKKVAKKAKKVVKKAKKSAKKGKKVVKRAKKSAKKGKKV